jgi:cytochrome c oxidase subunit 4
MSDMTTHAEHARDGHHGFAHPMPVWQLLTVFFALIILTVLTVYQSTFDLGNGELWLSLFIATIKAALVILFFMHMIHEKPFNAIVFISGFIFVALFIGATIDDAHNYKDAVELQPPPVDASAPAPAPAK